MFMTVGWPDGMGYANRSNLVFYNLLGRRKFHALHR